MKDFKETIIRGGVAKVTSQATAFVVRIGALIVLARLLEPKEFGLVGMVTAVIGVLNLFRDFGLSTATVQHATVNDEQISTLFWINIVVGALLGLLSLVAAPAIVVFYREPRLFWVTAVLATGFLFNAAGVQHGAILQREMRFTTLAIIDVLTVVTSTAVGIGMALSHSGYWALVGMTISAPVVSTLCVWLSTRWVPGRPRTQAEIRSMMRFGGTVTLNGLVVYIAYNFEKILLGRYWGAAAIGIYGRAYQLSGIPTENLNTSVGSVAFSALSRLQDQPHRLKRYFLKGYSLVLALTLPITIACALFANDAIAVFLGPKWREAAPIFRLLAPTILIFAMINPFSWLLYSIGLVGRSLKIALVIAPVVIAGYLIGLPYGPKGVALGYSAAMMLWVVPHIIWCVHGTVISVRDVITTLSRPLLAGIVAGVVSYATRSIYGPLLPPVLKFASELCLFAIAYLSMLLCVLKQKAVYVDLLSGLRGASLKAGEEMTPELSGVAND